MVLECDVIIVGAGMAGAGVGAELSRDRRVVLLEQEEHAGYHATGRSAALYSTIYGNDCIRILTAAGLDFFREGDEGRPFISPRGCIHFATQAQIASLDRLQAQPIVAAGTDRIGEADLRRLIPSFRPGIVVAALAEHHAYDLDVAAIHQAYLSRVRQNGGSTRCSAGVVALVHDGKAWTATAAGESFRAPVVVNAAGAWGDVIAELAGVPAVGLQPCRRTALLVDPPAGVAADLWPAAIDVDEQFYFKPDAGKVLMSPADETPMDPCDVWPEEMDVAITVDRVQQVLDIEVNRVSHSWAGLRTFAPDRTPVVGYDGSVPGFFWLVGQGGYGIQTADGLSRLAAALVRHDAMPADLVAAGLRLSDLSPERFGTISRQMSAR